MKTIKWLLITLLTLSIIVFATIWIILSSSLPTLDGKRQSAILTQNGAIERDSIGSAIITAANRDDAAFLLGFAHAQDRYFQMDMLRRNAAGELSELLGKATLDMDKNARFHQFRKRATAMYNNLPLDQKQVLLAYTAGANQALSEISQPPFEYLLLQAEPQTWKPQDSLLVSLSMYMDLQGGQVNRDLDLTLIASLYGDAMVDFFHLPSPFQAALDGSQESNTEVEIPYLPASSEVFEITNHNYPYDSLDYSDIPEPGDIGSNNWAVTGHLTDSNSAMLSNDMHLALRVPPIWYRAQLNYQFEGKLIKVTGVSLPGTPAVIVGSNGHIAWGFTNANLDNVDWIELSEDDVVEEITETINVKQETYNLTFEMSQYGPVKTLNDKKYALAWVAHQPYAVNMRIAEMAHKESVKQALSLSTQVGMPVQNLMVVDATGNAAWKPTGAVTARQQPSMSAISSEQYSDDWQQQEQRVPTYVNPENGRLWTANSRVISTQDLSRFGDGGYALGARGLQIRDRLFDQNEFNEQDFYDIQLDNEARFLMSWHSLLLEKLSTQPDLYEADINALNNWQSCACADSIGYTLVRKYRSTVINQLVAPLEQAMKSYGRDLRHSLRSIEPAIWLILDQQPSEWLPQGHNDYNEFLIASYAATKAKLIEQYGASPNTLAGLEWGKVNQLNVNHPIAAQLPLFKNFLNMQAVAGFGDSYMPAVQASSFGASQRLIVRPGNEKNGILTIPGGQSGHPLSAFYNEGFEEYATAQNTPLLPEKIEYKLIFESTR